MLSFFFVIGSYYTKKKKWKVGNKPGSEDVRSVKPGALPWGRNVGKPRDDVKTS